MVQTSCSISSSMAIYIFIKPEERENLMDKAVVLSSLKQNEVKLQCYLKYRYLFVHKGI